MAGTALLNAILANSSELVQQLPRAFIDKDLKRHREAVLLDRQKAMIPATQGAVEEEQQRRRVRQRVRELARATAGASMSQGAPPSGP